MIFLSNQKISSYLKRLRLNAEPFLKQKDLAQKLQLSAPLISRIESGNIDVSDMVLSKYAAFFNIPLSNLRAIRDEAEGYSSQSSELSPIETDFFEAIESVKVPYFESLSAGIEAELVSNNPLLYIDIPVKKGSYTSKKNLVAVKINGESMNKIIPNHSVVILDTNAECTSGNIVAYQLGNEYGIKRILELSDSIQLIPESTISSFKIKTINKYNMADNNFYIIGKMISFFKTDF